MKVLIVDDDRMICNGTARRITNMHFEEIELVTCAYSGEQAVELLKQQQYDAIFTDIRMAEMDGLQLINTAKNINPNLICVVITAFDRFQYAQQAIRIGVDDFLVKPLSEQSMRAHIETVVNKYNSIYTQKETRLELELCAQMISGEKDVHECFIKCGLHCPEEMVRMVIWQQPMEPQDFPELANIWHWIPKSGHFMLVGFEEANTIQGIDSIAHRFGCFAGISNAGCNLKELSKQATVALGFAWAVEAPCAILWTPQKTDGISNFRQQLLIQTHDLNAEGVRSTLRKVFDAFSEERCQEMQELVESVIIEIQEQRTVMGMEKGTTLNLQPGMGVRHVIDELYKEISKIKHSVTNPDHLYPVTYAKNYAQTHLYEPIDMAVLANHLNLSYAYFSRVFREQAGTTFTRYLLSLRMQEVCKLLLNGEKLVDIAEKLCYQNAANLTRSFTREFGISPSRWLESQKEQNNQV